MGEYNGGAKRRVPSLTERMENIRAEHIEKCIRALGGFAVKDDPEETDHIQHTIRFYIRSAVAATELAVNEHNHTREAKKAKAKQDATKALFHRPGRFGHG